MEIHIQTERRRGKRRLEEVGRSEVNEVRMLQRQSHKRYFCSKKLSDNNGAILRCLIFNASLIKCNYV